MQADPGNKLVISSPDCIIAPVGVRAHAAQRLADTGVGALIVVDDGRPVRIVTDRDLVVRGLAHGVASDSLDDALVSTAAVRADLAGCFRRRSCSRMHARNLLFRPSSTPRVR
jgi:CBS domain-containing protein